MKRAIEPQVGKGEGEVKKKAWNSARGGPCERQTLRKTACATRGRAVPTVKGGGGLPVPGKRLGSSTASKNLVSKVHAVGTREGGGATDAVVGESNRFRRERKETALNNKIKLGVGHSTSLTKS